MLKSIYIFNVLGKILDNGLDGQHCDFDLEFEQYYMYVAKNLQARIQGGALGPAPTPGTEGPGSFVSRAETRDTGVP